MIRRKYKFLTQVTFTCDLLVVAVSYFGAYEVLATWRNQTLQPFRYYLWVLAAIAPFWLAALWNSGLYDPRTYGTPWAILGALLKAQLIGGAMLLSAMFLTKSEEISRLLLELFIVLSGAALAAERFALKFLLDHRAQRQRGYKAWRVLLVGDPPGVARYQQLLCEYPYWGAEVVGTVDAVELLSSGSGANGSVSNCSVGNGAPSQTDWVTILRQFVVDEVVVVCPWQQARALASLGDACAERGLTFRVLIDMPPPLTGRYYVEDVGGGCHVISLEVVPAEFLPLLIKRTLDIVGAVVGLCVCVIFYPFVALWLRHASPGPVLFKQARVGRNGRRFILYKFRTMVPDAEVNLTDLLSHNEMSGAIFKMKSDPRIIPGGRFMRAPHIDELPQFFNVLMGDMSLVGTRPPTPTEAASYENRHHRRLSMKPGITGPWQVKGNKSVSDFEEVVKLDCDYIDNWSLWLDTKLLLKTCVEIVKAEGW